MLLLKIKNIVSWKPRPWPEGETAIPEEGQYFTRFIGDHPDNPEQGSVIIDVAILDGNFDNISSMYFLNEDPSLCRLVNFEKKRDGRLQG